ncbi:hypothetical protein CANARDRAFT_5043 [[Candida] arabinofermentans NRRL YB-2248]|uniref:RING-type E3 ubiquitin transferase n=1 Tax=[Candida] arabinofermentans NRRL YB-2248 TaxID=983967 RepID=A0A1E4T7J7_9ASCO|nr:hypothetical protein CANARDRAFT_5043 [[Candida] arabinofermentans NRRL YB-2248]
MAKEEETCRICRCEGTPEDPLFHPCKCRGSIKYIHQDCLTSWLQHSKKTSCDICHSEYTFKTLYDANVPDKLPMKLILRKIADQIYDLLYKLLIGILVMIFVIFQIPIFTMFTLRVFTWLLGCPIPHESIWGSLLFGESKVDGSLFRFANYDIFFLVTYTTGLQVLGCSMICFGFFIALHESVTKDEGFTKIVHKKIGPEPRLKRLFRLLDNVDEAEAIAAQLQGDLIDPFVGAPPDNAGNNLHIDLAEDIFRRDMQNNDRENILRGPPDSDESDYDPAEDPLLRGFHEERMERRELMERMQDEGREIVNDVNNQIDVLNVAVQENEGFRRHAERVMQLHQQRINDRQQQQQLRQQLAQPPVAPARVNPAPVAAVPAPGVQRPNNERANENVLLEFTMNPLLPLKIAALADLIVVATLGTFYFLPSLISMLALNTIIACSSIAYWWTVVNLSAFESYNKAIISLKFAVDFVSSCLGSVTFFAKIGELFKENFLIPVDTIYTNINHWTPQANLVERLVVLSLGYIFLLCCVLLLMQKMESGCSAANPLEGGYRVLYVFLLTIVSTLKVFCIFAIELVVFPIFCGYQLDFVLAPIFDKTGDHLLVSSVWGIGNLPFCAFQLIIGTAFMYLFATFASMARAQILRKGVLFFIRSPDDPNVRLIHDALMKPFGLQLSRISLSFIVYTAYIALEFALVTWSVRYYSPVKILPVEFTCLIVLMYVFFKAMSNKTSTLAFRSCWRWAFKVSCSKLRLSSFILGDDVLKERGYVVYRNIFCRFSREEPDYSRPVPSSKTKEFFKNNLEVNCCFVPDGTFVRAPDDDNVSRSFIKKLFVPVTKNDKLLQPITEVESNEDRINPYGDEELVKITSYTIVYRPPQFKLRVYVFLGMLWMFALFFTTVIYLSLLLLGKSSTIALSLTTGFTYYSVEPFQLDAVSLLVGSFILQHLIKLYIDKLEREAATINLDEEDDEDTDEDDTNLNNDEIDHTLQAENEEVQKSFVNRLSVFILKVVEEQQLVRNLTSIIRGFLYVTIPLLHPLMFLYICVLFIELPLRDLCELTGATFPEYTTLIKPLFFALSITLNTMFMLILAFLKDMRVIDLIRDRRERSLRELCKYAPLSVQPFMLQVAFGSMKCIYKYFRNEPFTAKTEILFNPEKSSNLTEFCLNKSQSVVLLLWCLVTLRYALQSYLVQINSILKEQYYARGKLLANVDDDDDDENSEEEQEEEELEEENPSFDDGQFEGEEPDHYVDQNEDGDEDYHDRNYDDYDDYDEDEDEESNDDSD